MPDYTKVYNQLIALAQKRDRDQITSKEWNIMVGTLALQLNTMGANLDVVHEQLNNISDLDEIAIADIMERLTTLEERPIGGGGSDIHLISDDAPAPGFNGIWFAPSGEDSIPDTQNLNINLFDTTEEEIVISSELIFPEEIHGEESLVFNNYIEEKFIEDSKEQEQLIIETPNENIITE